MKGNKRNLVRVKGTSSNGVRALGVGKGEEKGDSELFGKSSVVVRGEGGGRPWPKETTTLERY